MAKRALIVGCGYTGLVLGKRLTQLGLEVTGTTRSLARAENLERAGIAPLVGDVADREVGRQIDRLGPHVAFYLVPPQRAAEDHLPGILDATSRAPLEAFVYASSTSVYGDAKGEWVDETTAVDPEGNLAKWRQAAEKTIVRAQWEFQTPGRICRIAGIYGPGRTMRRALEKGSYALIAGHDTWANRIHVEDLVSGLIAVWKRGSDGRVYNMADDEPHRASEFSRLAAELHGLAKPSTISLDEAKERFDPEVLARKLGSRRVRNERLKQDLGVELEYPSFREGLPAATQEEGLS